MKNTALLLGDLQNDFIHADGAYGRAGQANAEIAALQAKLKPLVERVRSRGGVVGRQAELRKMAIESIYVAGIVTNGGVASTVRDAHVREFELTVLEDGCAAFSPEVHRAAIEGLRPVAAISTIAQVAKGIAGA